MGDTADADGFFELAQAVHNLRQMFKIADFKPDGEATPLFVAFRVVDLEIGDVGLAVGNRAANPRQQAGMGVGLDGEFAGEEAFTFVCPVSGNGVRGRFKQWAVSAMNENAAAGNAVTSDGFKR